MIVLAYERSSGRVPSGRLVPGPAQRLGPTGLLRSTLSTTRFLQKKHSDIFVPHCRTHATTAGASTMPPSRCWPSPTTWPSPAAAFPSRRRAPTPPRCHRARIPRRSLPPVALAHPAPLAPTRPHVANACFKSFGCFVGMFQVLHADVVKVDPDVAYGAMIYTYVASVCS